MTKTAEESRATARAWKKNNPEKNKAIVDAWRANNKEHVRVYNKIHKAKPYVASKKSEYDKTYRDKNADAIKAKRRTEERMKWVRANYKKRYDSDHNVRLKAILRATLTQALRLHGDGRKTTSIINLIGCSIVELIVHIEKQFEPGMRWNNHAKDGWHIDHIRPCASFDLSDVDQQKECFHYTNMRPLWAFDNHSKGAKFSLAA